MGRWGENFTPPLLHSQCPILLYERLRPKRSYAVGFTAPLSTSASCLLATQCITDTADGLNKALFIIGFKFQPQVADVRLDDVGIFDEVVTPDLL